MSRKIRLIYFFLVVFVFMIVTPILVAYIYGYRYDSEFGRVRKTGTLHVRTFPKKAEVFVNDKLKRPQTPESINGLLERVYKVKVQKDGYLPWEKKLKVEPGMVTRTDTVYLFPNPLEKESVLVGEILDFKISPDHDYAVFIDKDQGVGIINLRKNQKEIVLGEVGFEKASWSLKGDHLLLWGTNKDYYYLDMKNDNKLEKLDISRARDFQDVHWSQKDEYVLYFLSKEGDESRVERVDIKEGKKEVLVKGRLLDYAVFSGKIFYLLDDNNVYSYDEASKSLAQVTKGSLKIFNNGKRNVFHISKEGEIAILANNKDLILVDDRYEGGWKKVAEGAERLSWQGGSEKITYANENGEVWVYYAKQKELPVLRERGEKEMISRYGGKIYDLSWFFGFEYLLVGCSEKLKAVELDGRDIRNVVDLVELNEDFETRAEYSWKNEKLYIWNKEVDSIVLERK